MGDPLYDSLLTLNRLLTPDEPLEATLQSVIEAACEALDGIDLGSITVQREPKATTAAFTHADALAADAGQYEADAGPCLMAMRENVVVGTVIGTETRWPLFVEQASRHNIGSSLSLPLTLDGHSIGALNLYSRDVDGAARNSGKSAELFSRQASIAIANSIRYLSALELTEHLRQALVNRDVIGQAKGILMAQRRITAEEAFQLLTAASQRNNMKLARLAETVTLTGTLDGL